MQLFEQYRPKSWSDVVGQSKALERIDQLRKRGLSGRAFFLKGASGTGKTSIARLIAAEVADGWSTVEIDGSQVNVATLDDLDQQCQSRPLGKGFCLIVNECHSLRSATITRLLNTLEALPSWVTVILTTTVEGEDKLFADCDDAHPLLSRCAEISLSRRDLAAAFAVRAKEIAELEGLDGQPIERYIKLAQVCKNNLRKMLQVIEAGELIAAR